MYINDWHRRISPHNRLRQPPRSFLITSSILSNIYGSFHTKINSSAHIYIQTPQRLPLVAKDLRNMISHGRASECHHIRRQTACSQGRWVVMVRGKREDGKKGKARDRETQDLPLVGLIFWLGSLHRNSVGQSSHLSQTIPRRKKTHRRRRRVPL